MFFFIIIRRPPRSTRTDTLFPYTTLFRSAIELDFNAHGGAVRERHRLADAQPQRADFIEVAQQAGGDALGQCLDQRSEEHTSELQSLMRNSYAVFCLTKKNRKNHILNKTHKTHNAIAPMHDLT